MAKNQLDANKRGSLYLGIIVAILIAYPFIIKTPIKEILWGIAATLSGSLILNILKCRFDPIKAFVKYLRMLKYGYEIRKKGLISIHDPSISNNMIFENIVTASKIDMVFTVGHMMIRSYLDDLKEAIEKGAEMRMVICNPYCVMWSDKNISSSICPETHIPQGILESLAQLKNIALELADRQDIHGSMEIRLSDGAPMFNLVLIENKENKESKVARYSPYMPYVHSDQVPGFDIEKTPYGDLLSVYEKAFERIWSKAEPNLVLRINPNRLGVPIDNVDNYKTIIDYKFADRYILDFFYESRLDLPLIEKETVRCKEIWFAWQTGLQQAPHFLNADYFAKKKCRLIITDPQSDYINVMAKAHLSYNPKKTIISHIVAVTAQAIDLGFDVRWFDGSIGSSLVIGDPCENSAWVRVDVPFSYTKPNERPSFRISKQKAPGIFRTIWSTYDSIWQYSKEPLLFKVEHFAHKKNISEAIKYLSQAVEQNLIDPNKINELPEVEDIKNDNNFKTFIESMAH